MSCPVVVETAKQGGKALPVCVQTEETFRGLPLMCFMATAALKMISDVLSRLGERRVQHVRGEWRRHKQVKRERKR